MRRRPRLAKPTRKFVARKSRSEQGGYGEAGVPPRHPPAGGGGRDRVRHQLGRQPEQTAADAARDQHEGEEAELAHAELFPVFLLVAFEEEAREEPRDERDHHAEEDEVRQPVLGLARVRLARPGPVGRQAEGRRDERQQAEREEPPLRAALAPEGAALDDFSDTAGLFMPDVRDGENQHERAEREQETYRGVMWAEPSRVESHDQSETISPCESRNETLRRGSASTAASSGISTSQFRNRLRR